MALGPVTSAWKSAEPGVKPSGVTRSVYASTLLPVVSVEPIGSHGSAEYGEAPSVTSRCGTGPGGCVPSIVPVGWGSKALPCGPSYGALGFRGSCGSAAHTP